MKIYLDQHHFSAIGKGLVGKENHESYAEVFQRLKNLVDSGKITIFYSWCHVVEALQYYDLSRPLWKKYCEVVDTLTKGNCILFYKDLMRDEIELFLCERYGYNSTLSKDTYAYGKYREAFPKLPNKAFNVGRQVKAFIEQNIRNSKMTKPQRKAFLTKLKKQKKFRQLLRQYPIEEYLRNILSDESEDDFGSAIRRDIAESLTSDDLLSLIFGTDQERENVLNSFFNQVVRFERLVNVYGHIDPETREIAGFGHRLFAKVFPSMEKAKNLDLDKKITAMEVKKLFKPPLTKTVTAEMTNLTQGQNGFSAEDAINDLAGDDFKSAPLCRAMLSFFSRYWTKILTGRKPVKSDMMDLYHTLNAPYVDILVTEGFFAELIARSAQDDFKTIVLCSLSQLDDVLKIKF